MARCRLTWPDACRRWLPVWLPGSADAGGGRGAAVDHGRTGDRSLQITHRRQGSHSGPDGWDGPVRDRWHWLPDRSERPQPDPCQHPPAVSKPPREGGADGL